MVDEDLLREAARLAGGSTLSGVVDTALRDFVRRVRARRILELAGSGLWDGDLSEMRGDAASSRKRRAGS